MGHSYFSVHVLLIDWIGFNFSVLRLLGFQHRKLTQLHAKLTARSHYTGLKDERNSPPDCFPYSPISDPIKPKSAETMSSLGAVIT